MEKQGISAAANEDEENCSYRLIQAERQSNDAHNALDLLEPYPPRTLNGMVLTVAGRIQWYRDHQHEELLRRILAGVTANVQDVGGMAGRDWLNEQRIIEAVNAGGDKEELERS